MRASSANILDGSGRDAPTVFLSDQHGTGSEKAGSGLPPTRRVSVPSHRSFCDMCGQCYSEYGCFLGYALAAKRVVLRRFREMVS